MSLLRRFALLACLPVLVPAALLSQPREMDGSAEGAMFLSQELLVARLKSIDRLEKQGRSREALRELLELRTEVPRRSGLAVDVRIAQTYRSIAEALRDGWIIENQRGELVYRTEIEGVPLSAEERERFDRLFLSNRGAFTEDEWKEFQRATPPTPPPAPVPVIPPPPKAVVTAPRTVWKPGPRVEKIEVVSNWLRSETTNRISSTLLDFISNQVTNQVAVSNLVPASVASVTNWKISNVTVVSSNMSNTTNTLVVTNVRFNTNDGKTKGGGAPAVDTSAEAQIYNFFPPEDSMLTSLRKIQVETNRTFSTYLVVATNWIVRTNARSTSNAIVSTSTNRAEYWQSSNRISLSWQVVTNSRVVEEVKVTPVSNLSLVTNRTWIDGPMIEVAAPPLPEERRPEPVVTAVTPVAPPQSAPTIPGPSRGSSSGRPLTASALKYYDLSVRWLNQVISAPEPNPYREDSYIQKGDVFLAMKEPLLSARTFDFFARTFPRSKKIPETFLRKADGLAQLGRTEDAIRTLREILEMYPDSPQAESARLRLAQLRLATDRATPAVPDEVRRRKALYDSAEMQLQSTENRVLELGGGAP